MRSSRRLWTAGVIVAIAVVTDQLTKWWAEETLSDGTVIEILPSLELDLAYNSGFSFSAGAGQGRIIAVVVIVVCGILIWNIRQSPNRTRAVLLAVVLGGAAGNLVDRVLRADDGPLSGDVIDFIDVTWYAVFNVADTLIVCGSIALVATELGRNRRHPPDRTAPDSGADATRPSGSGVPRARDIPAT